MVLRCVPNRHERPASLVTRQCACTARFAGARASLTCERLCACSTIGVAQTHIQTRKRAVDVGATWKVVSESNVLMTEEEAKARLVLEIAFQEMEQDKEGASPG